MPYEMFDKEQRITHAAVTENKRLGDVLAFIKEQQEVNPPKILRVGAQRTRYEPTGRKTSGRKSWLDKRAERRAAEMAQQQTPPAAE